MSTTQELRPIIERADFLTRLATARGQTSAPLALAVTDLDDFAQVNERHGHAAGDIVLGAWERLLGNNVPSEASVLRIGGDEYAVLLPGHTAETALILLDEIRGHFARLEVAPAPRLTASVGVAAIPPHGLTAEDLWQSAEQALMRAKRQGRNQVAIYIDEKMVLKSNYYSRAILERLTKLSEATARTEASLLREALQRLLDLYKDQL